MARHPELAARSFVVGSFGKTYHTTGWKIGYAVAPAELTAEFRKVHQFVTFSTITPVQYRTRGRAVVAARAEGTLAILSSQARSVPEADGRIAVPPAEKPRQLLSVDGLFGDHVGARCRFRRASDEGARRRVNSDVAVPVSIAGSACPAILLREERRNARARCRATSTVYNPALRFHMAAEYRMTVMKRVWRSVFVWPSVLPARWLAVSGQGDRLTADTFKDFAFRSIGPGLTSGRIADVAIDPKNPSVWYIAAAVGGLWKTDNRGNTFTPVFDHYGSYSLGAVTVDPKDSNIVWLGTGENNNQRSVSFGDGVYKSTDAGSDVEAHGPRELRAHPEHRRRSAELERRLRDGHRAAVDIRRRSWSLQDDRRRTDVEGRADDQPGHRRHRHGDGSEEAGHHLRRGAASGGARSVSSSAAARRAGCTSQPTAAHTWTKLTKGLPTVEMGRIGLGINWRDPNIVYALVTAQKGRRRVLPIG